MYFSLDVVFVFFTRELHYVPVPMFVLFAIDHSGGFHDWSR